MSITTKVDIIIDGLRTRIQSGEFGSDGRLPSFRTLVSEYETSQETMNKAMQALQAEGLVLSAGAKGVFVNNSRLRMPGVVVDFAEYLKSEGFIPKSEFIGKPEIIEPPQSIMKSMKLKKGQMVLKYQRKQGTDRFPLRISIEYYPAELITEAMLQEIKSNPSFNILFAIKENFGETIGHTEEELIARLPTSFEQEHLEIVRTNPIIEDKRIHFTKNDKKILLYTDKIFNANHVLLSYTYSING